jgi:hypothetical protein
MGRHDNSFMRPFYAIPDRNGQSIQYNGERARGCKKKHLFTYPMVQDVFQKLIVTQLLKQYPTFFMEPEGSLPCSQKPATGPYPDPAKSSSPHRPLSP